MFNLFCHKMPYCNLFIKDIRRRKLFLELMILNVSTNNSRILPPYYISIEVTKEVKTIDNLCQDK